jgi:hypothetical protein
MTVPSFITDPNKFKAINGWLTVLWIVLIPVSAAFGLLTSVTYVSALSLYAIVTGHMSTWQAARVEARQEADTTEQLVQEIKQTQEEMKQTEKLNGLEK